MRKSANATIVAFTAIVATVGLWIASTVAAALAFGAIALIVPGTGTHNIGTVQGYKENAADRFINNSGVPCSSTDGCQLLGVDYPASFWPIPLPGWCPGLKCDTWNESVGEGVHNLDVQLTEVVRTAPAAEQIIIFGYSQGGAVVSRAMYDIPEEQRNRITVVTIGNINNPQGLWSRLSFLRYIPGLNISFGPQLPTKGIKSTNYSFEYDPVGDAPQYWGNPLAVANALMGFVYIHGNYLDPNSNAPTDSLPYGYDPATFPEFVAGLPSRTHNDATFVLIPQRGTLPIFMPLIEIGQETGTSAFIEPVVRLLQPVTKLLIDLGYDRQANPGIARNLSILPFNPLTFNPVQFSVDFVHAIVQGIEDAIHGTGDLTIQVPVQRQSDQDSVLAAGKAFGRLAADDAEQQTDQKDETVIAPVSDGTTGETRDEDVVADDATEQPAEEPKEEDPQDETLEDDIIDDATQDEDVKEEDVKEDDLDENGDVTAETPEQEAENEEAPSNDDGDDNDAGQTAGPKTDSAPSEEKAAA
ncbi:PE-PPE domain-containing protein [Mycobacterium sp. GA-2829]|uniref:PE-PPE domain-containing protein n=1 Tax=Mycobacterium sp. GA-2829 TaxID=1772283 RepID=UPI0007401EC8|nr:PE-PPE domain-containing protein [Mycobacterium sp. GA-2829]KUI33485.1 PE-PPE domain-containing protein [Mycobacterium sp. GA-2829]